MWPWPLPDHMVHLIAEPPNHDHWVKSFVLHWTFLAELGITKAALFPWRQKA